MNKKILSIFFLIILINGVFASSIDPLREEKETLYFQGTNTLPSNYSNTLSQCYTETLSPEAVERLWNEILVKGFRVDTLTSNQPANQNRETLEQNQVLITTQDTKADDLVGKTEIPNQVINPLEVPTLLGQVCYGPFTHGLDLDKTLRVGRCQGGDEFACYLEGEGLFRQNGRYGFWDQTFSVGKDLLDMIGLEKLKQTGNEIIDPELDYNSNVDLGLFTEMSYQELAAFRKSQFTDNNLSEVEIKKLTLILDQAIQNSVKTDSFNASMESTCNSDNCYINMYSLFDKVFNQYYSADLVFTSISPTLWKFSNKIFHKVIPDNQIAKIVKKSGKVGGITGKHGFLDNISRQKMGVIDSAITTAKFNRISRNMDGYITNLAKSNDRIITNINRYNLKPQFDQYLDALTSKKNVDTITKEFFGSGAYTKLNKAQKRVLMDSVMEFNDNIKVGRMIHDITETNIKNIAGDNVKILFDKTKNLNDFYSTITYKQYENIQKEVLRANKLNKEFDSFASNKFKWNDGADNISILKERGKEIGGSDKMMNKIRLKSETSPTEITSSSKFNDIFVEDRQKITDLYETRSIPANFADGPRNIDVILPYKETKGPLNPLGYNDIIYNKKPDALINYVAKDGTPKTIRGSLIDIADVDAAHPITMQSVKDLPLNPAEVQQFGLDPLEVSLGYFQNLGAKKLKDAEIVTDNVVRVLNDQGFTTGRGLNYINQRMKQQNITNFQQRPFDIIADSGKAYLYNFGYWQAKTAGSTVFGGAFDRYSMFRIPETYTSIIFKHGGTGDIYNDAYIDFFANDGSDQGDLFMQYINSLVFWLVNIPKEALANTEWETVDGFSNWIEKLTEGHIRRSFTDNIAILTDALNNNCNNNSCQITIGNTHLLENRTLQRSVDQNSQLKTPDLSRIDLTYSTSDNIRINNYILENTSPENFEKYGQTLIAFSHHTDYDGSIAGFKTADSVNLLNEIKLENTCSDRLRNLEVMGVPIGWTNTFTGKSYRAGAVAAGFSNLAYFALSVPQHRVALGIIFGDLIPQIVIAPEIYNCVDHEEGYYTHFFVAQEEYERIEKDPKNKVGDAISKGADSVEKTLTNITKNTELQESISQTTQEVKQFAETKIKDNPIMQSRFETVGNTSASFDGKLFFIELGEATSCRASGYNDRGIEHLVDNQKDETIIVDKEKGEVSIVDKDGNIKEIIGKENQDWVRLIATNLGIPAKVIPHSISYIPLPDTETPLFYIDVFGNLKVEDIDFLNCLKQNYFQQTGLEMEGNTLTDYLGAVKQITSTNKVNPETQYDIIPKGRQNVSEIVAEGTPRKIAKGDNAKITILGDRTTKIAPIEGQEVTIGKNIAIQFQRGQLIYNGEKNSYIMWVEQTYVMHQSEIKGMDLKPVKEENPITGCEEDAFEMSIAPDMSNPESVAKSEEMNKALEKVGPFQMFDTATKTFIFYTTPAPECENRIKIIDKKTGQVTDQAISEIIPTKDGFIVKTDDGMEHKFDFIAEDGIPKLKYNDKTETLLSAQGKNGSFWYDPKTGNWYTENGHLIPLDPNYRDGITFKVGEDGKVGSTTIQNLMNPYAGAGANDRGTFNIPLTPEKFLPFSMYILVIVGCFLYLFNNKKIYKDRKK